MFARGCFQIIAMEWEEPVSQWENPRGEMSSGRHTHTQFTPIETRQDVFLLGLLYITQPTHTVDFR